MNVENGVPDTNKVIELLNSTFDKWGDEELFQWIYTDHPGHKKDEHRFYIRDGTEIVAFRPITYKELEYSGSTIPSFVMGATAVAEEYQGQGMYSKLRDETKEYSLKADIPMTIAFNRQGNITYEINLEKGWDYRTLPLYLRIFSPSDILPQYAKLALDDKPQIQRLLRIFGDHIRVKTSDGEFSVSDLVTSDHSSKRKFTMSVSLSDMAVKRLVEKISNENPISDLVIETLKLYRGNMISIGDNVNPIEESKHQTVGESEVRIKRTNQLSDDELTAVVDLFDRYELTFRRNRVDIEHMVNHPHLFEILLAKTESDTIGFAAVAFHPGSRMKEARVLDIAYKNRETFEVLVKEIETVAREQEADLLALISDIEPEAAWTSIQKQVITWDLLTNDQITDEDLMGSNWNIGFYDIS